MAEIVELTNALFENHNVRFMGTVDDPLFVADDIGKMLDITNVRTTIKDFDQDQRVTGLIDTSAGPRTVTLLTELGLYELIFRSRKPAAARFRKWVSGIIKSTRIAAYRSVPAAPPILAEHTDETVTEIDTEHANLTSQSSDQHADSAESFSSADDGVSNPQTLRIPGHTFGMAVTIIPKIRARTPVIPYRAENHDVTRYRDKPCVYLFHLQADDYKYGVTENFDRRAREHQVEFSRHGCGIGLEGLWACETFSIAKKVESRIKAFALSRGHATPKYGKTEIITPDDIALYKTMIDEWLAAESESYTRRCGRTPDDIRHRDKELDIELAVSQAKLIDSKVQLARLENERIRLRHKRNGGRHKHHVSERDPDENIPHGW